MSANELTIKQIPSSFVNDWSDINLIAVMHRSYQYHVSFGSSSLMRWGALVGDLVLSYVGSHTLYKLNNDMSVP